MPPQRLFADYILNDKPGSKQVAAVLDALCPILRSEMRYRGVWLAPPAAWGYAGKSWQDDETLFDLLHDCFVFVFTGSRRNRLRDYVRANQPIAGAVRWSVRNFLNDLERKKNPAGHALFKNLQSAAATAQDAGQLLLRQASSGRITSQTVIASPSSGTTSELADHDVVKQVIHGWDDCATLGQRVTRRGPDGARAALVVLLRMAQAQPSGWPLGAVVDALKQALPSRDILSLTDLKVDLKSADKTPLSQLGDRDAFQERCQRTQAAIQAMDCQSRVKTRLLQLWQWMLTHYQATGTFPRQKEAASALGHDRQRVSDYYGRLQPVVVEIWHVNPDNEATTSVS